MSYLDEDTYLLCRNMVLQNESADEELEHFEDIVEEAENQTNIIACNPDIASEVAPSSDGVDNDSDSSVDEGGSPTSVSDESDSDGDGDLLGNGSMNDLQESEMRSADTASQRQVSNVKSQLPGGYNPRHREPSYRYFIGSVLPFRMCMCVCRSIPVFITASRGSVKYIICQIILR